MSVGPYDIRRSLVRVGGIEFYEACDPDGTPRLLQVARCRVPSPAELDGWVKFKERLARLSHPMGENDDDAPVLDHSVLEQGTDERLIYWVLPWSSEAEQLGRTTKTVASERDLARVAQALLERIKARHQKGLVDPLMSAELVVLDARDGGEARLLGLSVHVPDEWLIGTGTTAPSTARAPEEVSRKEPVRSGDIWRVGRALARFAAPLGGLSNDFSRILALLNNADPSHRYIRPIDALIDIEKLATPSNTEDPDATLALQAPIVRAQIDATANEATHPGPTPSVAAPTSPAEGVPSWAYMLTRERFDLLNRLVRRDLEAREVNFHIGTGVVVVTPISRDSTYEFGLTELARTVSHDDPARWPSLVAHYFDTRLAQTHPPSEPATPKPPAPLGIAQADTVADHRLPAAIRAAAEENHPTILDFPRSALQAAQEATRLRSSVAPSETKRRSTLSFVDPGDPPAEVPRRIDLDADDADDDAMNDHDAALEPRVAIAPSDTLVLSPPARAARTAGHPARQPESETTTGAPSTPESESQHAPEEDLDDESFDPFAARRNLFAILGLVLLGLAVGVAVLFPDLISNVSIESDTPFSVISADNEVIVDANPPGAEVVGEIDGRLLGTTPVRILVPRRQPTAVLIGAPGRAPQRLLLPDRGRVSTTLEPLDPSISCEVTPELPAGAQLEGIAATIGVGARVRVPGAAIVRAKNVRGAWILRCPSLGGTQAPALDRRRQFTSVNLDITEPAGMSIRIDDQPAGVVPISVEIQKGFVNITFETGGKSEKRWVAAMTDLALRLDGAAASAHE